VVQHSTVFGIGLIAAMRSNARQSKAQFLDIDFRLRDAALRNAKRSKAQFLILG